MRIHHKIILLTGLVLCINLGFQILWLFEFVGVKDAVEEYQSNWLPTVSQASQLSRRIGELRRMEYALLLCDTEGKLAAMARAIDRQKLSVSQAEYALSWYLRSQDERQAFEHYQEAKRLFLERHNRILAAMAEGAVYEAQKEVEEPSARAFQTMSLALDRLQLLNTEQSDQASARTASRFRGVLEGMGAALAVNLAVGVVAVWLTARRIGRPITELAACMRLDSGGLPACPELPEPVGAPSEIHALYRSYHLLTEKLASTLTDLENQAVTDALTGLANRRRLAEGGERILDICRRGGLPCSVLMADIDHFKKVNDTYGHAAGDAVLAAVARMIAGAVRASDLAARYGGEEFVVVAPGAGLVHGQAQAERLRLGARELAVESGGQVIRVTISVGVAVAESAAQSLQTLIEEADQALYLAKDRGRDRVEVFEQASLPA